VLLALVLLTGNLAADSIDDAEAKRRGVPVAQVQAESALAAEKRKEADLEKQIKEAQEKVATVPKQPVVGARSGPTSVPDQPPGSGAARGVGVESRPGALAVSPLHEGFVARYLAGDWEKLAGDMTAKEKEIAALPAKEVADLTYIKQVVAECRPAWWEAVEAGRATPFQQVIWKQAVQVQYEAGPSPRLGDKAATNGAVTVNWAAGDMYAPGPLALPEMGPGDQTNFGFRKRDGAGSAIWMLLGEAALRSQVGPEKVSQLAAGEREQYERFGEFRKALTAAYYGTPPVRRLVLFQSCWAVQSLQDTHANVVGKRPLGAAVLLEVLLHRGRNPTLPPETVLQSDLNAADGHTVEARRCQPVTTLMLSRRLTLEQDRKFRDLVQALAASNGDWQNSRISLGNDLAYDLDAAKDGSLAKARVTAFMNGRPRMQ
jgi:hypothetical protein